MSPRPLAWSCGTPVVLLVAVGVLALHTSVRACCEEDQRPIRDCSFSDGQDFFSCNVTELPGFYLDTCPNEGIADLNSIPGSIPRDEFNIKPYYTSCMPTDGYEGPQLRASSCHSPCRHSNEPVQIGLNISFKVEPWSAEDLQAITISIRHENSNYVRCAMFRFGLDQLSHAAADQHVFYYDGFIGLAPAQTYIVNVLTLPTNNWSNNVYKEKIIPYETCWRPDLKFHDTPFAVNLTLFQDLSYNFTMFDVHLYYGSKLQSSISVNFNELELFEMDGKFGTSVIFDCIQPSHDDTVYRVYVEAKDCPFCYWSMTEIDVKAVPPTFNNCPEHDIIHKVELGQYKRDDIIANVNWSIPTPVFQSQCMTDSNSTHNPLIDTFRVGRRTPVTYHAWQYKWMAECTFNVQVVTVDTTPPEVTCPANIHETAEPKMETMAVSFGVPEIKDSSETVLYMIIQPDTFIDGNVYHFPVNKNSTVTFLVKDAYNNSAKCNLYIYVEGTPSASLLVIILSCGGGLLLIMILVFIIWRAAKNRNNSSGKGSQEILDQEREKMEGFSTVSPNHHVGGIDISLLEQFRSSSISIYQSSSILSWNDKGREFSKSEPNIQQLSSGYCSLNEREAFIPSIGPRSPMRLESVEEEEVWTRGRVGGVDSSEDDGSLYGSQPSESFDESPVSLESTC